MRSQTLFPLILLLAACGERTPESGDGKGSTTPPYIRTDPAPPPGRVEPVRIGELGPNFPACGARGATRDRVASGPIPVQAAPYQSEEAIDRLEAGAEFFICARTYDQRWFGIVYDEGGRASARCGVSAPVATRRNYVGPCAAGWVSSAAVRLISGVPHQLPSPPSGD